jgi:hypothetical protein
MVDQAPESSKHVLRMIGLSRDLADLDLSQIEITTAVRGLSMRAETTITRSQAGTIKQSYERDRAFREVFRELPGYSDSYAITMGRTYTIEWDGIRAPI